MKSRMPHLVSRPTALTLTLPRLGSGQVARAGSGAGEGSSTSAARISCGPPSQRRTLHALRFALLLSACFSIGWLNPTRDKIDAGNRLFKQGKYDEAIGKYGELLVDDPDSPLLNYNMGAANYKAGKYSEAIASLARVKGSEDDPKRLARVAYNAGNAQYRLGTAAAAEKPQDALNAYAAALVAYRRALGIDPSDQDAKFNYELVTKAIADLKKKLEEQQQQEQPQDQQQQQDQQQGDEEQKEQQGEQEQEQQPDGQEQEQAGEPEEKQDEPQEPQGAGEQQEQDNAEQAEQQQAGDAQPSGEKKEKMSAEEAASLLDAAKNEEVRPEDFARKMKGGVADAAQDW